MRPYLPLILLTLGLTLGACSKKEEIAASPAMAKRMQADIAGGAPAEASPPAPEQATRRYLALRHHLVVSTNSEALKGSFEATLAKVLALQGEVLSAGISHGGPREQPSAELSVRLPPRAVDGLLAGLETASSHVIEHQRDSEDKTDQVIDAEARIKNLTDLRDRLRQMLATRPGNIKDVLEIERQLADTQAQLDTVAGLRKTLSNETDKVLVHIEFRARSTVTERGFFAPVAQAWDQAGMVLMNSLGALITFVAVALPWMLIAVPALALLRRWMARRRARKQVG